VEPEKKVEEAKEEVNEKEKDIKGRFKISNRILFLFPFLIPQSWG
jgi:hypothetical protein